MENENKELEQNNESLTEDRTNTNVAGAYDDAYARVPQPQAYGEPLQEYPSSPLPKEFQCPKACLSE